jgi:hypothetical protein
MNGAKMEWIHFPSISATVGADIYVMKNAEGMWEATNDALVVFSTREEAIVHAEEIERVDMTLEKLYHERTLAFCMQFEG